MSWVLAIDFGTTNTVASIADENGVHELTIDGRGVTPSAVMFDPERGDWTVGEAAVRLSRRQRDRYEPQPKSLIGQDTVALAGLVIPVEDLIAALLRQIVDEARKQANDRPPAQWVLTRPAMWSDSRVQRLLRAAMKAAPRNWPAPAAVEEPAAAAWQIVTNPAIPQDARIVVLDLGGGTVDAAVVDRHGPALQVIGLPMGIDSIGGEDFDLRLAAWMCAEAGMPDLFARRKAAADVDERALITSLPEPGQLRNDLVKLYRVTITRTDLPAGDYQPVPRQPGHRHAVYELNLILLALVCGGHVRASELVSGDAVAGLSSAVHGWRAALARQEWQTLMAALTVQRVWRDNRRDVVISLAGPDDVANPVDPLWTHNFPSGHSIYGPPANRGFAHVRIENVNRSLQLTSDLGEDVLRHALEPISRRMEQAVTHFIVHSSDGGRGVGRPQPVRGLVRVVVAGAR